GRRMMLPPSRRWRSSLRGITARVAAIKEVLRRWMGPDRPFFWSACAKKESAPRDCPVVRAWETSMKKSDNEVQEILSEFALGRLSRRQALRALGIGGVAALGSAAWPLVGRSAFADEAGKKAGPGGIALARPNMPVKLPLHGDPIKAGLK